MLGEANDPRTHDMVTTIMAKKRMLSEPNAPPILVLQSAVENEC
jgi:hypothetical protein